MAPAPHQWKNRSSPPQVPTVTWAGWFKSAWKLTTLSTHLEKINKLHFVTSKLFFFKMPLVFRHSFLPNIYGWMPNFEPPSTSKSLSVTSLEKASLLVTSAWSKSPWNDANDQGARNYGGFNPFEKHWWSWTISPRGKQKIFENIT